MQTTIVDQPIDIAIVKETKFSDQTITANITFPGYSSPIRHDWNAHGGGVAVWTKEGLPAVHLDQIPTDGHEVVWITVCPSPNMKFVLGAVYRLGSCDGAATLMIEYLETVFDKVWPLRSHIR